MSLAIGDRHRGDEGGGRCRRRGRTSCSPPSGGRRRARTRPGWQCWSPRSSTELRAGHEVVAVGIGAAGWVDATRTTVLFAPNLAWRNAPLHADLSRLVDLPVVVENDANAAAWGEHRFGAGEREPDTVVLTIGTGIGAGLIIDGELRRGRFGIAGEPGHIPGRARRPAVRLRQPRLSRAVLQRHGARARRARDRPGAACGCDAAARACRRRRRGDQRARSSRSPRKKATRPRSTASTRSAAGSGQALADLAAILDPGRFVIGGGVAEAGELLLRPARETYAAVASGRGHRPFADVVPAKLGAEAGLIGAADLARIG